MKKMRSRMIAHGRFANAGVDHGIDLIAYANPLFGSDLMRAHALNRRIASLHFGDDGVVIVGVKPSLVSNLPAGVGVERRVIEDDLAFFSRRKLLHTLSVVNNS